MSVEYGRTLFEKKNETTAMNPMSIISGSIILCKDMPEDFSADSSLNSPILPKVMSEARRIPRGKAVGTNVRAKW